MLAFGELLNKIQGGTLQKRAIHAPEVLNEAPSYGSAFSRGIRVDLNGLGSRKGGLGILSPI